MLPRTVIACAASTLLALPVAAQDTLEPRDNADAFGPSQGAWELLLGGSGSSDKELDNNVLSVDASVGYYATDNVLLGVRQNVGVADSDSDSSWNGSTVLFADYVFDFDRIRPFIGVSLGGLYGDDVDDTFIAGPQAGVKYYVKDETFLFGRVNYDFLFDSADDADSSFDDGRFVYSIGVGFNF